jgi:hypothetical protein
MVLEGGWTSANVAGVNSTPDKQARYLRRQAALLDGIGARAWLQTGVIRGAKGSQSAGLGF